MLPAVEIRTAYVWDCDHCGRENFERAVVCEFSPADQREMALEYDMEFRTGEWVTAPAIVKCKYCGAAYETQDYRATS